MAFREDEKALKNFRLGISIVVFCLALGFGINSIGAASGVSIYINDEKQSYSNQAVIENGRTLVPLRGIFESLGASVGWNNTTKVVTASKGNTDIWLKIGSVNTKVNGENVRISVPAQVKNGRTLVPLRFVSESLGASISWDQRTKTVGIKSYTEGLIDVPEVFIYDTNSVDGIKLGFLANNISEKTINYYTVKVSTYNPVGHPSYDQITGKSKFTINYVGPVYPGEQIGVYKLFTYQGALHKIVIDEITVEFSDGTTATQKYGYSTTSEVEF